MEKGRGGEGKREMGVVEVTGRREGVK